MCHIMEVVKPPHSGVARKFGNFGKFIGSWLGRAEDRGYGKPFVVAALKKLLISCRRQT